MRRGREVEEAMGERRRREVRRGMQGDAGDRSHCDTKREEEEMNTTGMHITFSNIIPLLI